MNPRPSVPQTDALPAELRSPPGVNVRSLRQFLPAEKGGRRLTNVQACSRKRQLVRHHSWNPWLISVRPLVSHAAKYSRSSVAVSVARSSQREQAACADLRHVPKSSTWPVKRMARGTISRGPAFAHEFENASNDVAHKNGPIEDDPDVRAESRSSCGIVLSRRERNLFGTRRNQNGWNL